MKCGYCNSNIPDGARVCPVCGAILPEAPEPSVSITEHPQVSERITPFTALKKYAVFSGRARRREYWMFKLLLLPVGLVAQLCAHGVIISPVVLLLAMGAALALVIPDMAVFWRRMHDVGKSGLMWFWNFLPMAGILVPFPGVSELLSFVSM